MASRMASRTLMASMSGGSPTALLPWMVPGWGAFSRSVTRKSWGVSPMAGIWYVLAECVVRAPSLFHLSSSLVSQPHALHEGAFDLAAIDAGVERVADVVEDVDKGRDARVQDELVRRLVSLPLHETKTVASPALHGGVLPRLDGNTGSALLSQPYLGGEHPTVREPSTGYLAMNGWRYPNIL